jgi:hypothetical protein
MKHSPNNLRKINNRLYQIAKESWVNTLKGKKRTIEFGMAISKSKKGKKLSDETKQKMSLVRKGKPRSGDPMKWKHSEESKAKMSISQKNAGSRLPIFYGDANPMKRPEIAAKISASKKEYWAKILQNDLTKDPAKRLDMFYWNWEKQIRRAPEYIAGIVTQMSSNDPDTRDRAIRQFINIGHFAVPFLVSHLKCKK